MACVCVCVSHRWWALRELLCMLNEPLPGGEGQSAWSSPWFGGEAA